MDEDILRKLEERLAPLHARQRLAIETDHEAQIFGQGLLFFHIENRYPVHSVIRNALKLTGLYWRARRNTERILVKRNDVMFKELPPLFDGFTILHISDMHVDMNEGAMRRLIELIGGMRYDLCVLTGDYRGKTFEPFAATLEGVARVRAHLKEPVYGVLGDHDTIQMVPGLEAMGIRMDIRVSWPKAKLVDYFLTHVPFEVAAEHCGAAKFIALDDVRPLEFLLYLYFGKTEEDLKNFALRDLGIMRTNNKKIDKEANFHGKSGMSEKSFSVIVRTCSRPISAPKRFGEIWGSVPTNTEIYRKPLRWPNNRRTFTWTRVGPLRFPDDPSCASAPFQDPGRTDAPSPITVASGAALAVEKAKAPAC